jgi:hypothetical protein
MDSCIAETAGRSNGRSLAALLASVALMALWIRKGQFAIDPNAGAEYRARRDLHHFQEIVATLWQNCFGHGIKMASGDLMQPIAKLWRFIQCQIRRTAIDSPLRWNWTVVG